MAISIRCKNPECGKPCRVKDENAGKSVKCPACGQRISVPSQAPAASSRESAEESALRVEPSAPRMEDRERGTQRAVWPWLVGMAAMLLVGAGGGYFLASQAKKDEDRPAQTDPKVQELAAANVDLTKRLSAAEEKIKDALASHADLTKRLSVAEEKARPAVGGEKLKPTDEVVKTKEDPPKAKTPATEKDRLLAERVADHLLAKRMTFFVANWTAGKSGLTNDRITFQTLSRFSGTDETLEMQIGQRFILFGPDLKVAEPAFELRVKEGMKELTKFLKPLATDAKNLDGYAKSSRESFVSFIKHGWRKSEDLSELSMNPKMTPAHAAELVCAASMVRSATTKELSGIQAQMKQGLVQAIHDNPQILDLYVTFHETSDEVRKSRERLRTMIKEAAASTTTIASKDTPVSNEPPVTKWESAKVAKLTLKIPLAQTSKIESGDWTKPDMKDLEKIRKKRLSLMAQRLARPGSREKVEDGKAVLVVIWLIREDAKTWPNKDGSLEKGTIHVKGTEPFLHFDALWAETYDLVLTGKPAAGVVITGKISGVLGGDTFATKITDATFELKPILKPEDRD